jgi:primosomal replication protein N
MLVSNWLNISGEITHIEPQRTTPAGIPIVEAVLLHRSKQTIGKSERLVECELTVQASAELAGLLGKQSVGARVKLQGVLNRRSVNSRQLMLILSELEKE